MTRDEMIVKISIFLSAVIILLVVILATCNHSMVEDTFNIAAPHTCHCPFIHSDVVYLEEKKKHYGVAVFDSRKLANLKLDEYTVTFHGEMPKDKQTEWMSLARYSASNNDPTFPCNIDKNIKISNNYFHFLENNPKSERRMKQMFVFLDGGCVCIAVYFF